MFLSGHCYPPPPFSYGPLWLLTPKLSSGGFEPTQQCNWTNIMPYGAISSLYLTSWYVLQVGFVQTIWPSLLFRKFIWPFVEEMNYYKSKEQCFVSTSARDTVYLQDGDKSITLFLWTYRIVRNSNAFNIQGKLRDSLVTQSLQA